MQRSRLSRLRVTRWRPSRGQALLELAVAFPFLAFLLLGVFDLGRVFAEQEAATNAAREGARQAGRPCPTNVVQTVVAGELNGAIRNVAITANLPADNEVRVTVSYRHDLLFGFFSSFGTNGQLSLSAAASMPYATAIPGQPVCAMPATPVPVATATPTNTPTYTPTDTPTNTPTNTPVPPTNTPKNTPTKTWTPLPTFTPSQTPTMTPTPTWTATRVPTSTPTYTPVPTSTPTYTAVPPTSTLVPPTKTPVPPTKTPVPPTSTRTATATATPPACPLNVDFSAGQANGNSRVTFKAMVTNPDGSPVVGASILVEIEDRQNEELLLGTTGPSGLVCLLSADKHNNAHGFWFVVPPGGSTCDPFGGAWSAGPPISCP